MIPFLDLKKLNAPYEETLKSKFSDFLNDGNYILGDAVESFEKEFASFCGTAYSIGTGNGFDFLQIDSLVFHLKIKPVKHLIGN